MFLFVLVISFINMEKRSYQIGFSVSFSSPAWRALVNCNSQRRKIHTERALALMEEMRTDDPLLCASRTCVCTREERTLKNYHIFLLSKFSNCDEVSTFSSNASLQPCYFPLIIVSQSWLRRKVWLMDFCNTYKYKNTFNKHVCLKQESAYSLLQLTNSLYARNYCYQFNLWKCYQSDILG